MPAPLEQFAQPLAGLKVLDLTQFLSGPYATQILGDLGAEVIKIEAPEGDLTRHLPPYFVEGDSAYYLSVNRNKHSIAIDLKTTKGQALVRDLAIQCDVIVENFRPGVTEKLGLSYDDLSKDAPNLVWCSISGFGQTGPYRDRPAYDMIIQAISGAMSLTGEVGGNAVRMGVPIGDIAAGMYGVIGILATVLESKSTGKGRRIDVSMLDCQIAMLSYQAAYHLHSGDIPGLQGRGHDSIPTYRVFPCAEGTEIAVTANTERMWAGLCACLGEPDLLTDPRFVDLGDRNKNREALWQLLERGFSTQPASHWAKVFVENRIPAAEVNTLQKSLSDPHVIARGMVEDIQSNDGHSARVAGNPIKFSQDAAAKHHRYPPKLGEDGPALLSGLLGLSAADIKALINDGVICTASPNSTKPPKGTQNDK
ncbi:CaiB/BaiF CoA-transferase family protein [Puniceibacterium sp. IMCC21224]|uniref:CaiB/BaiF CoA transferase family protein n=1 Tax=Puniceibacterium sp. IMCC21224 TaxID=1618204 RepID=UPI00064E1259|nr:CoA transferase [Puniceibacterium sp. IMCC21224]KMK64556.1 putative acyl-CoA transferase/carnitine dehydratase [Puniceibacterium sp. IMCC21224]